MSFSPETAAKRFGYGLSPRVPPPASVDAMLAAVQGPDQMRARFGIGSFWDLQAQQVLYARFNKHARDAAGTAEGDASRKKKQAVRREVREGYITSFAQMQMRRMYTDDGFRERLVAFWADHFTAFGKNGVMRSAAPLYVEDALRPFVTARFPALLRAAVTHPVMLHYLDQDASVGPNSEFSKRRGNGRGLNENLAREVLELHALGVDGPYDQDDVRALAYLFTGMGRHRDFSFRFAKVLGEPGPQEVLGKTYDGTISMARIEAVLDDLALHPATARHIATKLAVHFVADTPPGDMVAQMTQAFVDSDGDLMRVYAAMLTHSEAWNTPARNIRPPEEFMSTALRALALPQAVMQALTPAEINGVFLGPLRKMGQQWLHPNGPDGWDEADAAWVTPQGIAGRMEWAMRAPKRLLKSLPDPRNVVRDALGETPPEKVVFAANSAESRAEAIGLILMSPAFQRR